MAEILAFISLRFFRNRLAVISTSYGESIMEIVDCLHHFGPKIIREPTIDKHYIFHNNNSSSLSFSKFVFFVYIQNCIFDCNTLFYAEVTKPDRYEFSSTVRIE